MKNHPIDNPGSGQLRWVILLLAAAVILPTIGLLWFMTQAVKNVQSAVREELVAVYQDKLGDATQQMNQAWTEKLKLVEQWDTEKAVLEVFDDLVEADYDGAVIYDQTGARIYPLLSVDVKKGEPAQIFRDAWSSEFVAHDYQGAITLYEQLARSYDTSTRFSALIGKSRCLARLGESKKAISACREVAFTPEEKSCDRATLVLIANARLLLMELLKKAGGNESLKLDAFFRLLTIISEANEAGSFLPSGQRIFVAHKLLDIYADSPSLKSQPGSFDEEKIAKLIAAEDLSMQVAEDFPSVWILADWPKNQFQSIAKNGQVFYGLRHNISGKTLLLLLKGQVVESFGAYENAFEGSDVAYRILDESGRIVKGLTEHEGEPFATGFVGEPFAGWKSELYFKDGDVFKKAAHRQVVVYIWAGALVIVLILAAGAFAARAVNQQIKLNKLKNDFIATVSHELKTPLASMRVLVDTLLEGNVKDQKQATEYLHLTSKENKRLSRLIDNFLTFSRMERNKRAFEIRKASPGAIARDAAEAARTNFSENKCEFDVNIDENLPDVPADHDAMVTVLVNLLDNAYKYSYDEKRIVLKVFAEENGVCFQVIDNGIGMSRRSAKKIFSRFYQVDRSLSRRTEGCGLGLSIVKFIVDAHKGSISVKTKPGKGSSFTVKLPAAKHERQNQ
jgi:signal transduction histidine kinase